MGKSRENWLPLKKEPMPDKLIGVELNSKQREFRDIVVNGVKEWFLAK